MPDAGAALRPKARTYTIGRDKDCDIPIADDSVSRLHAELTVLADGKLLLADRASSNGTFTIQYGAAQRVTQAYLSPGDHVQFGSAVLAVDDLIDAIREKAAREATPMTLGESLQPTLRRAWKWVAGTVVHGRWREAVLVVLILAAAALLVFGDQQSPSFKFLIGILGSLIASLMFAVLQRFWEKK
jgi:hypothetical protein